MVVAQIHLTVALIVPVDMAMVMHHVVVPPTGVATPPQTTRHVLSVKSTVRLAIWPRLVGTTMMMTFLISALLL
jgi:hypothetical protein